RGLSSKRELRYGSRGSLAVDLDKGTWYDHETDQGGGLFDLVAREQHIEVRQAPEWLRDHGFDLPDNHDHHEHRPQRAKQRNGADGDPNLGKIVATYDYRDKDGELLFQVVRFDPKDFRQRRPAPSRHDGWNWSVKGVRNVPYRLHELTEAISREQPV